ncbi:MAG: hypothetical protein JXB10_02495 [Pirellulales bacterium]|nr:hypothetical protein [Pirellulales bacterium]
MSIAGTKLPASGRLAELAGRLQQQAGFVEVTASLLAGHAATLDGVWGSSCALITAALLQQAPGVLVVVCPHDDEADDLINDLALFAPQTAERFPAWESLPGEHDAASGIFGDRLRVLKDLLNFNRLAPPFPS